MFQDNVSPIKMTIWKIVKKYNTERSSFNINKDRSGRRITERTQEIINLLQDKLIEDPIIPAKKNGLDNNKNTFNRITKRKLK